MSTVNGSNPLPGSSKSGPAAERSFGRAANWTVGAAAAVLVLISVGGYFYHRDQLSAIAAEHLRLIVTGPSRLQTGVQAEYWVSTTAINSQPMPAEVEVEIVASDGKRLKAYQETVDDKGLLRVAIPADLDLPPHIRLKVAAHDEENHEEAELPIPVESAAHAPHLALDRREPSQPIETKTNSEVDAIQVRFYPEGGRLVAGLENRVYFEARNSSGDPVAISGKVVLKNADNTGKDVDLALVETTHKGRGWFNLIPRLGDTYHLIISNPKDAKNEPTLPEVSNGRKLVLSTGSGVFAAEKPLEFNIRAAEAGRPLIAAVYCRGIQVGQKPFVTQAGASGANPVVISLDDSIAGLLRLMVYDYGTSPPKLVAERWIYRHAVAKLNVKIDGLKKQYAPGETVELTALVTDDKNLPAPAPLGVLVVDAASPLSEKSIPFFAELLFLTGASEIPDQTVQLPAQQSQNPALQPPKNISKDMALDLLLGVQATSETSVAPPAIYDNLETIRASYEKSLNDYRADRTQALDTLTTTSFFGGLGLVLIVAMLGLMRIVSGLHLWAAAIGAATCCLIIGAILTDPGRLGIGNSTAVPFSPFPTEQNGLPESKSAPQQEKDSQAAAQKSPSSDATETARPIYWNPMLMTDKDGKAVIRFQLSDQPATYRIAINAHEAGRIGSFQTEITSKTEAQKDER